MNSRTTLLLLPALLLGTAGLHSADAAVKKRPAPKPVCNLIADPAGDQGLAGAVKTTDGDDLVGGDFSSDGTTVTGVVKLAALAAADPSAPLGRAYYVDFTIDKVETGLFLSARVYPNGVQYVYGYRGVDPVTELNTSYTLGTAKGVLDTATKTIRISAPASGFAPAEVKVVKGSKVSTLAANVWRISGQGVVPSQQVGPARVPLGGLQSQVDAGEGVPYVVGAPSCVKPVA